MGSAGCPPFHAAFYPFILPLYHTATGLYTTYHEAGKKTRKGIWVILRLVVNVNKLCTAFSTAGTGLILNSATFAATLT
jgi:hypothetical protein